MEKPSRAIFITVELILAIFTATMAVKISTDEMPQRKVAVIVEDSGNSKWDSYVKGLKDAAKVNNLHLVICNTDKGLNPEEEKELMEEQESKGVSGFILQQAQGSGGQVILDSFHEPILLNFCRLTDPPMKKTYPLIAPDNEKLGEKLGECIVEGYNGKLEGRRVGVVCAASSPKVMMQRQKGLQRVVEKAGGKIAWTLYREDDTGISDAVRSRSGVSAIAVLDTESLEEMADAAAAHDVHGAVVYGIGASIKTVYSLENESIAGLVTADLYDMGYRSVTAMAQYLSGSKKALKDQSIEIISPKKNELFSEKYQTFLATMER